MLMFGLLTLNHIQKCRNLLLKKNEVQIFVNTFNYKLYLKKNMKNIKY